MSFEKTTLKKRLGTAGIFLTDIQLDRVYAEIPGEDDEAGKCLDYLMQRLAMTNAESPVAMFMSQYRRWIADWANGVTPARPVSQPQSQTPGQKSPDESIFVSCRVCGSSYQRIRPGGCPYCEEHPELVRQLYGERKPPAMVLPWDRKSSRISEDQPLGPSAEERNKSLKLTRRILGEKDPDLDPLEVF